MKKILIATYTLILLHSPALAFAQSPTPSSIRDAVAQKVAEEIAQIKKDVKKKAYVGSISTISDGTLTLITLQKASRNVTIAPDATIKLSSGPDGTSADLKTGLYILVMGDSDGSGTLTAKRLLIISKPSADNRQAIFGIVTKITSSAITLTPVKSGSTESTGWTVKLSSTTKYTPKTKFADIDLKDKIIVIGAASTTPNTLTARLIHLVQSK